MERQIYFNQSYEGLLKKVSEHQASKFESLLSWLAETMLSNTVFTSNDLWCGWCVCVWGGALCLVRIWHALGSNERFWVADQYAVLSFSLVLPIVEVHFRVTYWCVLVNSWINVWWEWEWGKGHYSESKLGAGYMTSWGSWWNTVNKEDWLERLSVLPDSMIAIQPALAASLMLPASSSGDWLWDTNKTRAFMELQGCAMYCSLKKKSHYMKHFCCPTVCVWRIFLFG